MVVSNAAGSVTSAAATLSVQWAAEITRQPMNRVVVEGATATFTVVADANPAASLQWEQSSDQTTWAAIEGATQASHSVEAIASLDGTWYRVVLSNSVGTTTSEPASLSVLAPGAAVFPIGVWMQGPLRTRDLGTGAGSVNNAANYKSIGVNIFVGLWQFPAEGWAWSGYTAAAAQALLDNGLTAYAGNNQAAVDWIDAHPQFTTVFAGYMLGDEPDMNKVNNDAAAMPDAWQAAGDALRTADPNRGVYANFGKGFALDPWVGYHVGPGPTQADDFAKYVEPLTVMSSDYYAITNPYEAAAQHGVWGFGRAVDNTIANAGGRPVWGFLESSNPWNTSGVTTPPQMEGRMTAELIMPSVWEMVVHGAQGIIYFCHDFSNGGLVEDGCLAEPGMPAAMQEANESVQMYAAVLATPDVAGTTATSDGEVDVATLTKQLGGVTYVFAMGDGNATHNQGQAVNATITVAGAGDRGVEVLGEARNVTMTAGQLSDHFDAYQLHIYRF